METLLSNDKLLQRIRVEQLPAISILLPFEPKMSATTELDQKIRTVLYNVKETLKINYSHTQVNEMMLKLNNIVSHLDYRTYKVSLAIFVSPAIQKVYYLDIPVKEKIVVDEPFELRDLVYNKREFQKYLALVLSGEWTRIYKGNGDHFSRIVSNIPEKIDAFRNDIPERVGNFSDPSHRREVMLKKFLRYTDNGLSLLLESYPLPVFVLGPEKLLGYYKHMTKNARSILGYVQGNFINVPEASIRAAMLPHIADWQLIKQQDLLNQIEVAASANKLAVGMRDVIKEARQKKGRLLIIEKNFYPPEGSKPSHIFSNSQIDEEIFFINDAVDKVIEQVLESGGDVEFVEDGILKEFGRIAMIKYY